MFQSSNLPNSSGGGWGIFAENSGFQITGLPISASRKKAPPQRDVGWRQCLNFRPRERGCQESYFFLDDVFAAGLAFAVGFAMAFGLGTVLIVCKMRPAIL